MTVLTLGLHYLSFSGFLIFKQITNSLWNLISCYAQQKCRFTRSITELKITRNLPHSRENTSGLIQNSRDLKHAYFRECSKAFLQNSQRLQIHGLNCIMNDIMAIMDNRDSASNSIAYWHTTEIIQMVP